MLTEIRTFDALEVFEEVLRYVESNWGDKIVRRFYANIDLVVSTIRKHPDRFQFYDKSKEIRWCLPNKHVGLYSKVRGQGVYILRLYATRKNPEGLNFET